ncbi:MAG: hypothetical protein AAFY76_21325 [Cyanobacteria bacterium J06649_11]
MYGTEFGGESIIYKGDTFQMLTTPLEAYLGAFDQRSLLYKQLLKGCWNYPRGYQGLWKLEGASLYLVDVYTCDESAKSLLYDLFRTNEPVEARWYSGELAIQRGKLLKTYNLGFNRFYEEETVVQIEKGKQLSEQHYVNGHRSDDNGFTDDREAIAEEFYNRINWETLPELSSKYRFYVMVRLGQPDSLWILRGQGPKAFENEVHRIIDEFQSVKNFYYRVKPMPEIFGFAAIFGEKQRKKMTEK